ncbi:MAG: DUF523 domain-containing protein [Clostridia bacterium]|nr:DUF523 domain-containing protein [Clostridia bacterium]
MNLLISGCLLGLACRYDGDSRPLPEDVLQALTKAFHLVPVCPEQLGGLSTPRNPAERVGERVVSNAGEDVTKEYQKGAQEVLRLAKRLDCRVALLKEKSPACGSVLIYDGSFEKNLISGNGVATELLKENGIRVFGESELEKLLKKEVG